MSRFAVLAAILLAACASSPSSSESSPPQASTTGSEAAALVPPGEATIGDRTTCPVTGEEFVVTEASPAVEHEGRTYYLCCPPCVESFRADPARYLSPAAS